MTGSALIPVKALVMNTLSLGAVLGALVWIFLNGYLSGLLGFQAFGAIKLGVPVVVLVFAFGLSMDYKVFLLSRITECNASDVAACVAETVWTGGAVRDDGRHRGSPCRMAPGLDGLPRPSWTPAA